MGIIIIFAILLTLLVDMPVQKIKGILLRSASKPKENEAEVEAEEEEMCAVQEPEERECENNISKLTPQMFTAGKKANEETEERDEPENENNTTNKLISQVSTESQKSEEAEEDEEES